MALLGLPPLRPNFDAAVRDVAAKNPAMRVQAAERLGDAEPEELARAVKALCAMLKDRDARVRCAAVEACSRLQAKELEAPMLALLDDTDATVREVVVVSLSKIGGHAATAAVRRALTSEHPETRFQAVMSFVELCPDDAQPLAPLIHDEDPMVRAHTAQALDESRDPNAQALLRECLDDHNAQVRRRAAIALAHRGEARGYKEVVAALDDPELAFEAFDALGVLGNRDAVEAIAYKSAGLLQPLLIRAAAGGALVRLGDPRGVDVLRRVLTAWRADGRSFAVELVGSLGVRELLPVLERLTHNRRGCDATTLARALAALTEGSPGTLAALKILSHEAGEAGEIARAALKSAISPA